MINYGFRREAPVSCDFMGFQIHTHFLKPVFHTWLSNIHQSQSVSHKLSNYFILLQRVKLNRLILNTISSREIFKLRLEYFATNNEIKIIFYHIMSWEHSQRFV